MQVKFELIHPNAKLPERGHSIDVGLDVFTPEGGVLKPGPNKVPLGFAVEVPVGYSAEIRPRSGMVSGEKTLGMYAYGNRVVANDDDSVVSDYKMGKVQEFFQNGVALLATDPPIDPGYTGEVHAIVVNLSDMHIEYDAHTRFGQLVFYPIAYAHPVLDVDRSRGDKGFGSSGVSAWKE